MGTALRPQAVEAGCALAGPELSRPQLPREAEQGEPKRTRMLVDGALWHWLPVRFLM